MWLFPCLTNKQEVTRGTTYWIPWSADTAHVKKNPFSMRSGSNTTCIGVLRPQSSWRKSKITALMKKEWKDNVGVKGISLIKQEKVEQLQPQPIRVAALPSGRCCLISKLSAVFRYVCCRSKAVLVRSIIQLYELLTPRVKGRSISLACQGNPEDDDLAQQIAHKLFVCQKPHR